MQSEPQLSRNILVVEDEPVARLTLTALLQGKGHSVSSTSSAEDAFEWLRTHPAPDLILLDLWLPGADGWEFRRKQQAEPALASIPVVILSSDGDVAKLADALGNVGYLQKPINAASLFAAVERFGVPQRPEILIVDDEPGILRMLGVVFRHAGFTVRLAGSGKAAVELYRQHATTTRLVLLDVQMGGMDGPQTLVALREVDPQVVCCFISGATGKYTKNELLAFGARKIIPKPFEKLHELPHTLWTLACGPEGRKASK